MRQPSLRVTSAVLIGVVVWWGWAAQRKRRSPPKPPAEDIADASVRPAPAVVQPGAASATPPPPGAEPPLPGFAVPLVPPAQQRAFRFVLNQGQVALEAVEDVRGDFRRRRDAPVRQAGMFCYRLLDAGQRVLAEEIAPAPDYVCVVLDPNTPDATGRPLPVRLTPPEPIVFQVRMPKVESATQIKIYRLTGSPPAALPAEPPGRLLATIALPQ